MRSGEGGHVNKPSQGHGVRTVGPALTGQRSTGAGIAHLHQQAHGGITDSQTLGLMKNKQKRHLKVCPAVGS